ncbi:YggT family protein [Pectobacterium wasabiae]|uniref:Membrane protein n=1 Tax=Pectobacterium wasabiae TaxID=55208 RepID=A0AAW3EGC6_9GAMM|nr:YggT family protein [Pectobacterium wasabiae]AOR62278.1 hypothetical protein A7983_03140 [Pectobacterium wasabiae CFBP 3304]EJS92938.1 Hypothetical protein Y17_3764 [Pectobacterium wasabiae CFBP 3304]KFX06321.1 membrane protein [Pectobacterium wasabiae]KGA28156.1 membrane protein [Pectobacterium wasabiae]
MLTLTFLITLLDIPVMVLLLRIWMQWSRSDFYNPLSQFVVKITQPAVGPLRRILPSLGPIDSASLVLAFVVIAFKLFILVYLGAIPVNLTLILISVFALAKSIGHLIFWVIIIRSIMSWVSQGRSPVEYLLHQLTEPLMAPIRRILPAMGGIDFSAMVVILILYLLKSLTIDLFTSLNLALFPGLWSLL